MDMSAFAHQVHALGGTNADGLELRMIVLAVRDEWPTYGSKF